MIKSMTGYSREQAETSLGALTIELKTWNHRHSNVTVRLPPLFTRFEHCILSTVRSRIHRGQAQVTIDLVTHCSDWDSRLTLNLALAKEYYAGLTKIRDELHLQDQVSLTALAQLPGVLTRQEPTIKEDSAWGAIELVLQNTLDGLDAMKSTEGHTMFEAIAKQLETVQSYVREFEAARGNLVEATQQKLETRMNKLFEGRVEIDRNRLAMEAGVIASRSDITEELVRLDSHCTQFEQSLHSTGPVGRQLDFLLQEMNREINAIASKASSLASSSVCVSLKTEIEKIREIVQNVE